MIISCSGLLRKKNVLDKNCRENQNTHFMPQNIFEYYAVYKKTWKNIAQPDRPWIIWRIRISRWVPKATNSQSENVIFIAFPLQHWLQESASILRYTYVVCLDILVLCGFLNLQFQHILQSCFCWSVTRRMRRSVPVTNFHFTSCCEFTQ
jgi:hypothetical protein